MPDKRPEWFPDWKGETVVIVASGPSAGGQDYEAWRGRARFIVVNCSWKLVPWADVLVAADGGWWQRHKGAPDFPGMKVTVDFNASRDFGLHLVRLLNTAPGITVERPGHIGMGRNTGFYAINLAVQFGPPAKIILAGYDMNVDAGIHWHGPHPKGMNNPRPDTIAKWRKILDGEAATLRRLGVDVVNASPSSALVNYPKMSLAEAFDR